MCADNGFVKCLASARRCGLLISYDVVVYVILMHLFFRGGLL